ncbi:hypothetical protein SELMODRAFT_410093 [Selaginella moellendorffii]|uniref:Uncharacterized protein n=1 Tax=Selaginella moellendorffii TaxID=88036 RepID=D8RDG1_SELML|nr:hypothetical protein SELMODRAFT_410093 [Selaginella moellendorffii]
MDAVWSSSSSPRLTSDVAVVGSSPSLRCSSDTTKCYAEALRRCGSSQNLWEGKRLHFLLKSRGYDGDTFLRFSGICSSRCMRTLENTSSTSKLIKYMKTLGTTDTEDYRCNCEQSQQYIQRTKNVYIARMRNAPKSVEARQSSWLFEVVYEQGVHATTLQSISETSFNSISGASLLVKRHNAPVRVTGVKNGLEKGKPIASFIRSGIINPSLHLPDGLLNLVTPYGTKSQRETESFTYLFVPTSKIESPM